MDTSMRFALLFAASALAGCGRDATQSDVKLAGVGLNPDEIGPAPAYFGGLVEYDWVNLAGSALPLGVLGLVSYDGIGPELADYKPPYALVYGLGFVFGTETPAPDRLFGSFGAGSGVNGTCATTYAPQAYISNLVDVGQAITIRTADATSGYDIGRRPVLYAPKVDGMNPYYLELGPWHPTARTYNAVIDSSAGLAGVKRAVLSTANFAHGVEHLISWPGAIPPQEAVWSSIPMPLAASTQDVALTLPTRPTGVRLSWDGPRFDPTGAETFSGSNSTCLQYFSSDTDPGSVSDCVETWVPTVEVDESTGQASYPDGQMYTGPWDTSDGVTVEWQPSSADIGEVVTISVRFLAKVDPENEYMQDPKVSVEPNDAIESAWSDLQDLGYVDASAPPPTGLRDAQPCEEEGTDWEWTFDQSLCKDPPCDGTNPDELVASLQGDPSDVVAEVTCQIEDSAGSFKLTDDIIAQAHAYALEHQAEGAIFYIARTTSRDLTTPPVRDQYGKRHDIPPVRVVSNAVDLGRFWFE